MSCKERVSVCCCWSCRCCSLFLAVENRMANPEEDEAMYEAREVRVDSQPLRPALLRYRRGSFR